MVSLALEEELRKKGKHAKESTYPAAYRPSRVARSTATNAGRTSSSHSALIALTGLVMSSDAACPSGPGTYTTRNGGPASSGGVSGTSCRTVGAPRPILVVAAAEKAEQAQKGEEEIENIQIDGDSQHDHLPFGRATGIRHLMEIVDQKPGKQHR